MSSDSRAQTNGKQSGFKTWTCCFLAVWPQAKYFTSLGCFSIRKEQELCHRAVVKIKGGTAQRHTE